MRTATVQKLQIERDATVKRLAELEEQQTQALKTPGSNTRVIKRRRVTIAGQRRRVTIAGQRRRVTIAGQRRRVEMLDRLIAFKESENGKE